MSDLVGRGSPAPENRTRGVRWEYRLGGVLRLGLEVAQLAPVVEESRSDPALTDSSTPRLVPGTSDALEARALGRWAWEGGRTY